MSANRRGLTIGAVFYAPGSESADDALVSVERSNDDEIQIKINAPGTAECNFYLSLAAAYEIQQLLFSERNRDWPEES